MTLRTPGFSAAAWQAATAPWVYTTASGCPYAAREISTPRLIAYFAAIEDAAVADRELELRDLLRDAFPKRFSFLWRGDPVEELLALPPLKRQAALDSFFVALGVLATLPGLPMSSPGSSSN